MHPGVTFTGIPDGSSPGTPTADTLGELDIAITPVSTTWNNYQAEVGNVQAGEIVTVTNLNDAVCSIENWPLVEHIAPGSSELRVTYKSVTKTYRLTFAESGGGSTYSTTDYSAGGHIEHAWDTIKPLVDAEGAQIGHFSSIPSGGSWNSSILTTTRNANCWAFGFDLSGIGFKSSKRCPLLKRVRK